MSLMASRHSFLPKKEVQPFVAHGLYKVVDVLSLKSRNGIMLILLVESEEHHLPYALLELIDMVHEHLHIDGHNLFLLHGV